MDATAQAYRTFFLFTLKQRSAMRVGGRSEPDQPWDDCFARDGDNRVVMRGRGLVGNLIATARTFIDLPDEITRPIDGSHRDPNGEAQPPSIWEMWHAFPWDEERQRLASQLPSDVRVTAQQRHDTRAAASAALADQEVMPRGTEWRGLLEVVHPPGDPTLGRKAALIAGMGLREWERGRCWHGAHVSRGMGWLSLVNVMVRRLPARLPFVDLWPDTSLPSIDAVFNRVQALGGDGHAGVASFQTLEAFIEAEQRIMPLVRRPVRAYVRWTLRVGPAVHQPEAGGPTYGFDALSIGGHAASESVASLVPSKHIIAPAERAASAAQAMSSDFSLAMEVPAKAEHPEPALPGSAVAGSFRHHASRRTRSGKSAVLDPATGESYASRDRDGNKVVSTADAIDPVTLQFGRIFPRGSAASALPSRLMFGDGELVGDWRIARLQSVGLDEQTQGPFGGSKFDRLAVLDAKWHMDVVQMIPLPTRDESMPHDVQLTRCVKDTALMRDLLNDAERRRIAIGGAEFRGFGYVDVHPEVAQWAVAGDDWQDFDLASVVQTDTVPSVAAPAAAKPPGPAPTRKDRR